MERKLFIDATDGILGRVASFAAKQALLGKEVTILNCNDVLLTGNKKLIQERYRRLRRIGGASLKGPKFPKTPERIMKRTVRGMLSHKQTRGRTAFKRVMCYNKTPAEFESTEKVIMKRDLKVKAFKLKEISEGI